MRAAPRKGRAAASDAKGGNVQRLQRDGRRVGPCRARSQSGLVPRIAAWDSDDIPLISLPKAPLGRAHIHPSRLCHSPVTQKFHLLRLRFSAKQTNIESYLISTTVSSSSTYPHRETPGAVPRLTPPRSQLPPPEGRDSSTIRDKQTPRRRRLRRRRRRPGVLRLIA